MAIDTGIGPFSAGFLNFCVKGSNIVPSDCRILLVGQKTDEGTANTNEVVQVIGQEAANTAFGAKSNLAQMVEQAICACGQGIYAIALDGVGNNAEFEIPVVVDPITEGGLVSLTLNNQTFTATALVGDAAADVAQAIADAVNADASFPYIATVVGDSVILPAANLGEVGNQLVAEIETSVEGATVGPMAQTVVGAGVPDSTAAIEALGACCYDCIAYEGVDAANVDAWKEYTESTFGCGPIQCFSQVYHGFKAETAGEIVLEADSKNCRSEILIPIKDEHPYTSYEMAAAWAARSCCACCEDAGRPAVRDNGVLGCLGGETDCMSGGLWTPAEKEALANAGAGVWDANAAGQLWIELNYTTFKQDQFGNNDITWQLVETRCAVKDFLDGLRELVTANWSSAKLFTDGTELPVGGGKAVTPRIIQNEIVAYMENEVGITLDNPNSSFQDLVEVCINEDDPNRVDLCVGVPLVNSLLRIAGCVNIDVSNTL